MAYVTVGKENSGNIDTINADLLAFLKA